MLSATPTTVVAVTVLVLCVLEASPLRQVPLIPFHTQRKRRNLISWNGDEKNRRRRAAVGGLQQVDAAYQGYGTHYVDFWVGTPPQRQTVIIGTGGGATGVPCSMCHDCGSGSHHTDAYFDETASETFQIVPCDSCSRGRCSRSGENSTCRTSMSYGEGSSWHGFEVDDMVYLGGPHDIALTEDDPPPPNGSSEHRHDDLDPTEADDLRFMMTFSCQSSVTGLFKTQMADGILGMDYSRSSYWTQARNAGVTDATSFSLCYARQPTPSRNGTEAGAMTMGGFDSRLHNDNSPVVYAKMSTSFEFFDVTIKGIYLRSGGGGDSALSLNDTIPILPVSIGMGHSLQAMLESGTTDTYLSRSLAVPIKEQWEKLTDIPFDHVPRDFTEEQLDALPTFLFRLQGDVDSNFGLVNGTSSSSFPLGTLGSAVPDASRLVEEGLDVVVAMPPSHYMEYDGKKGHYVNRLYLDESTPVFGANWLMGHDVSFEPDNARVGFAESDCDYLSLLEEFDEPDLWEGQEDNQSSGNPTTAFPTTPPSRSPTTSPVQSTPAPTMESSRPGDPDNSDGKDEMVDESIQAGGTMQEQDQSKHASSTTSWGKVFGFLAVIVGLTVPAFVYGKQWAEARYGMNIRYHITGVGPELELQDTSDRTNEGGISSSYTSPELNIT